MDKIILKPQGGKQEMFLACGADICIYGGAAGGGKSYGLLLEPLRHVNNPNFATVVFRRTNPQILHPGGLWAESFNIYSKLGATPRLTPKPTWVFPSGAVITFSHLEMERTKYDWQGAQVPLIMFDELTHFSESVFFYMLSRNRSMCGVKPYVRATCNPDADSWVAKFIEWWIDQDTGYPIEERCGKARYFIRRDETIYWADTKEELYRQFNLVTEEEKAEPRSVAFINSRLQDNALLMKQDPSYIANLKAMSTVERERLLMGNWKIKPSAGLYFNRTQVGDMLPIIPKDIQYFVRAWDLAATTDQENGDAAYTAGVLMGKRKNGNYVVIDVTATLKLGFRKTPAKPEKTKPRALLNCWLVTTSRQFQKAGARKPAPNQWQAGNFNIVVADWNEGYFSQMESFPVSKFKDMVDATSSAFAEIEDLTNFNLGALL